MTSLPPESEEDQALRRTTRTIATKCQEAASSDESHDACWQALTSAGLHELRSDLDGEPAATVSQCVIVVEELARSLCGAPLLSTLLARELLRLAAVPEDAVTDEALTVLLTPELDEVGGATTGVAYAATRPVVRAVGRTDDTLVVTGLGEPLPTQDLSRPLARPGGEAVTVAAAVDADALRRFEAFARVLLAADMLGAASSVFEQAVEYSKQRVQFGQPVGAFQAVQHLCARAYVQLEALRSAVLFASWALDADDDAHATSLVAKAYAGRASVAVAETATQVFGGVAITWEFPAHRHLRRTLFDSVVLGAPARLGALLQEEAAAHGLH